MTVVLLIPVIAVLVGVAVAGIGVGLVRSRRASVEPFPSPLEERRQSLLLSLKDLEAARASGALEEPTYSRLRAETEVRMARVLRALEEPSISGDGHPHRRAGPTVESRRGVPRWVAGAIAAATAVSVAVTGLLRTPAAPAQPDLATEGEDPLAFFESRVEEHPRDLAARLDLAHRYLDAGRYDESAEEYVVALELDPDDAEAHAHLGLLLHIAGDSGGGLRSVEQALETDPRYPEALFLKGVILLEGLDRPEEAGDSFRAYLEAAPFGSERDTARRLIDEIEAGSGDHAIDGGA